MTVETAINENDEIGDKGIWEQGFQIQFRDRGVLLDEENLEYSVVGDGDPVVVNRTPVDRIDLASRRVCQNRVLLQHVFIIYLLSTLVLYDQVHNSLLMYMEVG